VNFHNLTQLMDYFKSENRCKAYLEKQRWGKHVACVHCGSMKVYRTDRGFKCGEKECYKKFSVTVGTIFENSKMSLRTWFAAMYLIASHKKGISSLQLHRDLGVTQKTAWFLLHRIREALRDKNSPLLCNVVEVDETYVGGKMKNKHKKVRKAAHESNISHTDNKTCVVALLERNNKVKAHVHNQSGVTLKDVVKVHVDCSAQVFTDSLNAYKGLDKHFAEHQTVNHNEDEYVRGEVYTNSVEGFFSLLKRGIYGIYHSVSPKHLPRYCHEFEYRYNSRRMMDNKRFEITLQRVNGRLKYKDLIAKDDGKTKQTEEAKSE
jgi:transposase-like protein